MKRRVRYDSVLEMMKGEKMPKSIRDEVKKLIEEDKKHLTVVKKDDNVFLFDKRTNDFV